MGLREAILLITDSQDTKITIDLQMNDIGDKGAQDLAIALASNNTFQEVDVNLFENKITPVGGRALAKYLSSNDNLQVAHVDLSLNELGDEGGIAIIAALISAKSFQKLDISLAGNDISNGSARAIANLLKSDKAPQDLHVNLSDNSIDAEGAITIAEALASGKVPPGLHINLGANGIGDEGAIAIAKALASGKVPPGLHINLANNKIGPVGAKAIAKALASGKAPQGLHIDLCDNKIGDEGAKLIAEALVSGKAPQGLHIELRFEGASSYQDDETGELVTFRYADDEEIGPAGLQAFIDAIKSKKMPYDVEILGHPEITRALDEFRQEKETAQLAATLMTDNTDKVTEGTDKLRLPVEVVGNILSYLHPKGPEIVDNVHLFRQIRKMLQTQDQQYLKLIAHSQNYPLKTRLQTLQLLSSGPLLSPEYTAPLDLRLPEKKLKSTMHAILGACLSIEGPAIAHEIATTLTQYIQQYAEPKDQTSLTQAVHDFCKEHKIELPAKQSSHIEELDEDETSQKPQVKR